MNQVSKDVQPVMSSLEIASLSGKQHKNVMADIRNMFEQLEINSAEYSAQYQDSTGRTLPCFELSRYYTEILVTGYDIKRRAAVIDRWFELESRASVPSLPDFSNPVEAARAWADAKEAAMKAMAESQAAKPAVEFVERYVNVSTNKTIRETAKILNIPEKRLISQMIEDRILYRQSGNLLPYQKHHDAGRFTVKTGESHGYAFTQTRITTKGIDYLANAYGYLIGGAA